MIAIQEQHLRHAEEAAAQRKLDQQSSIGADMVGDQRRALQSVPADHAEHVHASPRPQACRQSVGLAGPVGAELGVIIHLALGVTLVDDAYQRLAQDGIRIRLEGGDTLLDKTRANDVVVRRPFEVAAARLLKDEVEIPRGPEIAFLPIVANASVPRGIRLAERWRRVGRCVVRDDQLEIGEGLRQDRFNRLGEVELAVVDGEAYADWRSFMHREAAGQERCRQSIWFDSLRRCFSIVTDGSNGQSFFIVNAPFIGMVSIFLP
jgi:hypothetical protein